MKDTTELKFVEVGNSGTGFCLSINRLSSVKKYGIKALIMTSSCRTNSLMTLNPGDGQLYRV